MVMFLMVLCLSMFGLAVTCLAFAAATGGIPSGVENRAEAEPERKLALSLPRPRFFTDDLAVPVAEPRVPLEVLLAQIERGAPEAPGHRRRGRTAVLDPAHAHPDPGRL